MSYDASNPVPYERRAILEVIWTGITLGEVLEE